MNGADSSLTSAATTRVLHHLEHVMGTVVVLDVYAAEGTDPATLGVRLARARAGLQRADATFSTWKPDSPISRLRRGEAPLAEVPAVVGDVLEACARARELSDGWFDPWAMPGGVDPTGYVKGWAAARALDALWSDDLTGVVVNAAGDIAAHGAPQPGERFRFGIRDPHAPGRLACVAETNGAIATSATYERGDHLIDPRTGRPGARAASATVTGPDLGLADALATALAVGGIEALACVERLDRYEALLISEDGSRAPSSEFPFG